MVKQNTDILPVPEALALREGQNVILEDSADVAAAGGIAILEYEIPGVQGQMFRLAFVNRHLEPPTPYVPVRIDQIFLYRPKQRGGRGQKLPIIEQGAPYIDSLTGTGENTFLLFALEQIEPKSTVEIHVRNIDPANAVEVSVVLVGDLFDVIR